FYVGFLEEGETLSLMDIGGLFIGGFSEVQGLDMAMSIETVMEGGVNDRVHRLPGRIEMANLTLTKGVGFTDDLWNWVEAWQKGEALRKSVFILLANSMKIPLKIWAAERCLPVRYTGPSLNASQSALAIEKLELAPEKLTLLLSTGDAIEGVTEAVGSVF
ncbi:MAG: phage tail protein, partial [Rhodobacteraceae bacterium]|nr:phage tail protein [Paracoccaceae bacterium]